VTTETVGIGPLKRWTLTEGLLLAAIPVVAYVCAFLFELGYCDYLNIPMQFISVGKNELVSSSLFVLVSALGSVLVIEAMSLLFRGTRVVIFRALLRVFPLLLLSGFVGLLAARLRPAWWVVIGGVALLVAIEFVSPLIEYKQAQSYQEKLRARELSLMRRSSTLGRRLGLIGYQSIVFTFCIVLFLAACVEWGRGEAATQKSFMVIAGPPQRVVLRVYGDFMVTTTWDKNRRLARERSISKLAGEETITMAFEDIGPLMPAKE
jgi:hypothetical protein